MSWFITYCVFSIGLFLLGAQGMALHWFWNSLFSLLAAGTIVYATLRTVRARLCYARLRKALNGGKTPEDLRRTVEAAFRTCPDRTGPRDAWHAGFFAYLPAAIVAFVYLGLLIGSTGWRLTCALALAIPVAVVVGKIADRIAAQELMFERAKTAITGHNPRLWEDMTKLWHDRWQAKAAQASTSRSSASVGGDRETCSDCGRMLSRGNTVAVLDNYATGGCGFVEKTMCKRCAAKFMKGKKGLYIE
jgi:hypothetical protein